MGRSTTRRKPGDLPFFLINNELSGKKVLEIMTTLKPIFWFCLFVGQFVLAQNDSITPLKEVIVSDTKLRKFSNSQTILSLNDSILSKNSALLSNALQHNSVLYFKEYGRGMLATVAFRGTTASQTAVVWNGININSPMNGSADFNTLSGMDFQSVAVKSGGGSVIYGSGAMGGTVHLNNDLKFDNAFTNKIRLDYGSFNTQGIQYQSRLSRQRWSAQIGVTRHFSDNDYPYPDSYDWQGNQRFNENGAYELISYSAALGVQLDDQQLLKFYSQTATTDRNNSLLSSSESRTKYRNQFSRNLLAYDAVFDQWTTSFKTAYIREGFQYFPDNTQRQFTFGNTQMVLTKADVSFQPNSGWCWNAAFEYNNTRGEGSGFGNPKREVGAIALLVKQETSPKWQSEFGIRKEFANDYESPLLFSIGSAYRIIKGYKIKINASRNFRMPTFNDLYWVEGGNPNLKPESAYQAEMAHVFAMGNFTVTQTFYYNKIKNLLRWLPGNNGVWSPFNTDRVASYGLETLLGWKKQIGTSCWEVNGTYAYTVSRNEETQKQLFFVPFHKATGAVAYSYKKWSANYQVLYNGFVYTQSDNDPKAIVPSYWISNIGIDYEMPRLKSMKMGVQVLNLWNAKYESIEHRIMPGRNFNLYLIFKL